MSENIFKKNHKWYALRKNVCLIPVTGTFEHRGILGWRNKVPYFVRPLDQPDVFFLPGLYSNVYVYDGRINDVRSRWTFGLDTREPSPANIIRQIHNDSERGFRMALYLTRKLAIDLMKKGITDEEHQRILQYEMTTEEFYYHTTWTIRTGKLRGDGLDKDAPFIWPKLPPLGTKNPRDTVEPPPSLF